jgi:GT2 family glycosyltransferase
VYLHNQDGYLADDALEKIVAVMEADVSIGAAQSLMMLRDFPEVINNSGNSFHYFGFGYITNFKNLLFNINLSPIYEIGYASGGAVLLRTDILEKYGLWDEDYFFYHEDLEYSLRLKSVGYSVVLVRDAVFYHKYQFSRNQEKFYYMERNRFGVMLLYFKWQTLLLLLPMALVMELGLIGFSIINGWFGVRLKVYAYWLAWAHWKTWLEKRKRIQAARTVSDAQLLRMATDVVIFDSKDIDNPLLRYVANPLLSAYWYVAKKLIFW